MVAVINNFGGFYRTEVYVHEARMSGAVIENPCVNRSNHLTRAIGKHIYLGFIHINGLGTQVGELIEKERAIHGDYKSLDDFIERVPIGLESIQRLIFVGAFRFTGLGKNELTFKVSLLKEEKVVEDRKLFNPETKPFVLPDLVRNPVEDAFDEIELLGFPTSYSPFQLLKTQYRGDTQVSNLLARKGKRVRMVAYLISRKHVPTNQGLMNFGTWIDSEGNLFDSTHFPRSLEKNPFAGGGCYLMEGIVDIDYNFPTLTVEKMAKLPFVPDPRYSDDDPESQQAMSKTLREDVSVTHRAPYPSAHEIGLPRHKLGDSKNRRDKIAVKNKKDLPAWMKKKKYLGKSKEAKPHAHRLMELGGGRDRPRAPKTEDDSETDLD
jgi:DNA polymerase III alpha subunit